MVTLSARVVIKFDLSEIPTNAQVNKAELSFYTKAKTGNAEGMAENGPKSIYKLLSQWDEAIVNWEDATGSSKWNVPGGEFAASALDNNTSMQINVWEDYDVTVCVQEYVQNPLTNNGLILMFDDSMELYGVDFVCSENSSQERRPKLTIEYEEASGIKAYIESIKNNLIILNDINCLKSVCSSLPEVHQIVIQNSRGQMVAVIKSDLVNRLSTVVNSLQSGIHFISLMDPRGRQIKIIRYINTH